jgi:ABC-type Fe3+ transport system substrate-binding protein
MGLLFVKLVVSPEGQQIFVDLGQPPIVPAVGSGEVPDEVRGMVEMG